MKRINSVIVSALVLAAVGAVGIPTDVKAAEESSSACYKETYMPAEDSDGRLTVEVTAMPDEDGYLYIEKNAEDMTQYEDIAGENIKGTALEEYTRGSKTFYRIEADDPAKEASVTAQFTVPGFYKMEKAAEDNGAENENFSYSFTNYLPQQISGYSVTVYLPENMEFMTVSKPGAYEDFKLSESDGMRAITVASDLAPAGKAELAFSCAVPFTSGALGKGSVWAVCLAVGIPVFIVRFRKAGEKKE